MCLLVRDIAFSGLCKNKPERQDSLVWLSSTRIEEAGIAIRHSPGRILFYTAGSRMGLERGGEGGSVKRFGSRDQVGC